MIKIGIVQEPPVYLNLNSTMEKAVKLVEKASREDVKLLVFPEAWFPGYPTFIWRLSPGSGMVKTDTLFEKLQANSIDLSKNGFSVLQEAARENDMVVVAGYHELDSKISGSTLFNSCIIIDADGSIRNNHRKLMPTNPERMIWGFGDGSGLNVIETAVGRIGTLICWESYMPLARYALYSQNIDLYIAPTWDSGSIWLATLQHIAREGGCWVIGCATALEASDIPKDFPYYDELFPDTDEWINPGDAVIYKPFGDICAGPMHKEKGLLLAQIDINKARTSRRKLDVTGHYARPDVFKLSVNRSSICPIKFID